MVRILLADSCEVVRTGIRETLRSRPDCEVVAEADDGRSAISLAMRLKPDIAIVELALPIADGIEVTARMRRRSLHTDALIFTLVENETLIREALTAGVAAWIRELMWAASDHESVAPDVLLRELTWDRRHLFQSAGLFSQVPWKVM